MVYIRRFTCLNGEVVYGLRKADRTAYGYRYFKSFDEARRWCKGHRIAVINLHDDKK